MNDIKSAELKKLREVCEGLRLEVEAARVQFSFISDIVEELNRRVKALAEGKR